MEVHSEIETLLTEALERIMKVMTIIERERGKITLTNKAILIFDILKAITNGVTEAQAVLAYLMHYIHHLVLEPQEFNLMIRTSRRALFYE